jgi:hypothetical protein
VTVAKALDNRCPITAYVTTDEIAALYTRPRAATFGGNLAPVAPRWPPRSSTGGTGWGSTAPPWANVCEGSLSSYKSGALRSPKSVAEDS